MVQLSKLYQIRPSKIVGIEDTYVAYCFDEACAYIQIRIDNEEKPAFNKIGNDKSNDKKSKKRIKKNQRMLPSEIYERYK